MTDSSARPSVRAAIASAPLWTLGAVAAALVVYNLLEPRGEDGDRATQLWFAGFWCLFLIAFMWAGRSVYRRVKASSRGGGGEPGSPGSS